MENVKVRASRNSSVELLRIISIFMVLFLHMNKDMMMSNNFPALKVNMLIMYVTEALCIVAVNCFILITGYFSVTSNRLKVRKVFDLIFLVSFYGVVIYLILVAAGREAFGIKPLIKCAFPYFFDKIWFINIYIVLYLFIPFINKCLNSLTKKQYTIFLVLVLLIFSLWPNFVPNPPYDDKGYSIISFIMIYSIGGYLRLHCNKKTNPALMLLGYVLTAAVTCVLMKFRGFDWLNYNSVFVIASSVFLFKFFVSFDFHSKFINYVSASVLSVFIIHAHQCIRPYIFLDLFNIDSKLMQKSFILYYILTAVIIFVSCIIIDILRRLLFKCSFDKLFDKIKALNYVLTV